MPKCTQCGFEQDDGSTFCTQCGLPLVAQEPEQQPDTPDNVSPLESQSVEPRSMENDVPAEAVQDTLLQEQADSQEQAPSAARFCTQCGNGLPIGGRFCAFCGAKADEIPPAEGMIPVSEPYYPDQEGFDAQQPPEKEKKRSKKPVILAVAVAAVLVICVSAVLISVVGSFLGTSGGYSGAEQPVVYIQDSSNLKFKTSDMDRAEIITRAYDAQVDSDWILMYYVHETSSNGRYLLYLNDFRQDGYYSFDGRGDLYLRDLSQRTGDGQATDRGTKIASDVSTTFAFSDDDSYIYYINTQGELYAWDFNETYRLDSDVAGVMDQSATHVFYYKGDEVDYYTSYYTTRDFYVAPLKKDGRGDRIKIDSDISNLVDYNEDFTKFIYTKKGSGKSGDDILFDVYLYDAATDGKETLITDVDSVVDGSVDDGSVLYALSQSSSISFDDIIDDDMKAADALIEEPDLSNYPLLEEYYGDSYSWLYGFGDDDVDFDALWEEWELYEEEYKVYEEKLNRDRLRESIQDDLTWRSGYDISLMDLYYLKDGERDKVDGGIYSAYSYYSGVFGDIRDNYVAYVKVDLKNLEKVKMSEIENSWYMYSFDVESHLQDSLGGDLYFTYLDGEPMRLLSGSDDLSGSAYEVYPTDEGIYYLAEDASVSSGSSYSYYTSSKLFFMPLHDDGSFGQAQEVDSEVQYFDTYQTYQGKYIYMSNIKERGDTGDLYTVLNGEKDRLCYDVSSSYSPYSYNKGNSLLFYENYDSNRDMGELYLLTNGDDKVKVADDVYYYYYRSDNLIYVLRNYRAGKGDLYAWTGPDNGLDLIDYDVTTVMRIWQYEDQD